MYKLLHEEHRYLSELKQAVVPFKALNEEERLNEYLDYLDFMQEADELLLSDLYENSLIIQEIDVAKLKSDILRFLGLKRTLADKIKGALGVGNTSAAEKLKNQLSALNDKIAAAKKALSGVAKSAAEKGGEAVEVVSYFISGAPRALCSRVGDDVSGIVWEKAVVLEVIHDLGIQDLFEHGLGLGARGALPIDSDERHSGGRQNPQDCHNHK